MHRIGTLQFAAWFAALSAASCSCVVCRIMAWQNSMFVDAPALGKCLLAGAECLAAEGRGLLCAQHSLVTQWRFSAFR